MTAPVARATMAANLARFERIPAARPDLKAASVALCVVSGSAGASLLITRRAPTLRAHAGQWALPGGRREPGESVTDAARRELVEETGLDLPSTAVLGVLDDYVTRSGYVMTPVVLWGDDDDAHPGGKHVGDGHFAGALSEVATVHVIPLSDLDVEPRLLTIPESDAPVIQLPLLGRYLHAPTAAIVYQFCQVALYARNTRVAHFEQPVFAWT